MRRAGFLALIGMLVSSLIACANAPPTATAVAPPTVTVLPTATITPFVGVPQATPAFYPTPTTDTGESPKAPGTLRNANWPFGTPAIATYAVRASVDVDVGAIVLTVPVPEGTTLTFYVAIPPQRGFAGRVSFPVSPNVQALQPGDAIRLIGVTAGTVRVPPTEGTYTVPSINGLRFARNNAPLAG
ncbi:MAG: hypothetical protein LC793_02385 [Thermomicrobia bacterium]|nr:hypothetical protein [Thermomicrobia bacterium]MCA1724803.1 hypothetical protein [Thermomicrobia bacterium]